MTNLSKAQLKFLRKVGQKEKPIFQMGKQGLTEAFIEQIDFALEKRELIKFNLLQNTSEEIDQVTERIAQTTQAHVVQVIGSTAVLYRPSKKEKYQSLSQDVAKIGD